MSDNCYQDHPLKLDGTSQDSRVPSALDPSTAPVEGRSQEQLEQFLFEFSKLVQYYSTSNLRDGSWENLINEALQEEKPHEALLKTFIELLEYLKEDLNELTARHLDFYYKEVLQMQLLDETPDKVDLLIELAKNVNATLVPADTYFKAGKDDEGNPVSYKTTQEFSVNKTQVSQLKALYLEQTSGVTQQVYAAPIANSADGLGAEIEGDEPKWNTFGESQVGKTADNATMQVGDMGFVLSSPLLFLAEGTRTINLKFEFEENHGITATQLGDAFSTYYSGAEGWVDGGTVAKAIEAKNFTLTNILSPEVESIVAFDPEVLEGSYTSDFPAVKLVLGGAHYADVYAKLSTLPLSKIVITVTVVDMQGLVLQSQNGVLDNSAPFMPFGPSPAVGSNFYIGSKEVFQKKLRHLKLKVKWFDIPSVLYDHYDHYSGRTYARNYRYKTTFSLLQKGEWQTATTAKRIINTDATTERTINLNTYIRDFDRNTGLEMAESYKPGVKEGFLKMTLTEPNSTNFKAFGHRQYPLAFTRSTIKYAKSDTEHIVAEPYTPQLESLKLEYKSRQQMPLGESIGTEAHYESRVERLYQLTPFGSREVHPYKEEDNEVMLLKALDNQGELYIGLENLDPPQNVSLLFQVADGTANPDVTLPDIEWSYLSNDEWKSFESDEILAENTLDLVKSGIVTLDIPKDITKDNSLLDAEYHWIRASVAQNAGDVSQLLSIDAQAIQVEFEDQNNVADYLAEPLEAGSISKLKEKLSAIKKIDQPFASYGGKVKEQEDEFYRRVSERLRHKKRPVTMWDYERLVLEEFPSVHKVKCLSHTSSSTEVAPGHVALLIISNLRNKNAVNQLEPKTSIGTLEEIKLFLEDVQNPFIKVSVDNPKFEQIKVEFNVEFHTGYDKGIYLQKLNEDIVKFLSPWAFEEGQDIVFEGKVYKSVILHFVEELAYIDYVTCFKMHQYLEDGTECKDIEEAEPSKATAILVSHQTHTIGLVENEDCSCEETTTT